MPNLDLATSSLIRTTPASVPCRQLPPLVLHPCDHQFDPSRLSDVLNCDTSAKCFLEARYAELRMLCFVGKDINRWLGQCLDTALADSGISEASLIGLLLFDPPSRVVRKMQDWKINNSQVIFSRALGLNAVYPHPPEPDGISEALLRDMHHYADALFDCRFKLRYELELHSQEYDFEIYSSAEYARILSNEWERP
jgi:hypothetical protein